MDRKYNYPKEGELVVPMTNDYLFKALLQENEHVLKGLLCSLLHMSDDDIVSTKITNSIVLGEAFTEKTFMLDVRISLNNNKIINLEMQVINYNNWPERSMAYLCREFSKTKKGSLYEDMPPVHQIGILNFTLFKNYPTFYSTYMMQELNNHNIYSDKFALSVLDLTQIDKATAEDKSYKLDHWARLFSAKTWEDLNMLAKDNPLMAEATNTILTLTEDELIREACYRREEQLAIEAQMKHKIAEQEIALAQKDKAIAQKDAEIIRITSEKDAEIASNLARIRELERLLKENKR